MQALAAGFDREWGGFGAAPKFPSTMSLDLVLDRSPALRRPGYREIVTTSLDAMASGGMYDHIGGGFARYSVDREWLVPHFEKMLYDQALLVRVYAHAAVALDEPRWRQVVAETVEYVLRDLRQPAGGFSSAEDADSPGPDGHGHEGLFHTWTVDEVRAVLGRRRRRRPRLLRHHRGGNFEGRSIPNRLHARGAVRAPTGDRGRPPAPVRGTRAAAAARARRQGAHGVERADDLHARRGRARCSGRPDWIDAAAAAAEFLRLELRRPDGRWYAVVARRRGAGRPATTPSPPTTPASSTRSPGSAEATGEARWIDEARAVADTMLDHFWDVDHGGLFTTPDDGEALVARQKDLFDNATPSANSTAAVALYPARRADRRSPLRQPCRPHPAAGRRPSIDQAPTAFSHALAAVALREHGITEVAVVGDRPDLVAVVAERWRPDVVLAWGEPYDSPLWEGRTDGLAYVCQHYACQAPQRPRRARPARRVVPGRDAIGAARAELGGIRCTAGSVLRSCPIGPIVKDRTDQI